MCSLTAHTVTISVLVNAHTMMQVAVAVMRLHDGKPHYCWLPLQKRTEKDSVSGEVHLRMQWSSEDLDNPVDAVLNLTVDLALHGIGLSVVESSVKALPREVNNSLVFVMPCNLCTRGQPLLHSTSSYSLHTHGIAKNDLQPPPDSRYLMFQVFHALFENIHMDYKYSPANQSARFAVHSVQIDNQLLSSTHPVVLCHSSSGQLGLSVCSALDLTEAAIT